MARIEGGAFGGPRAPAPAGIGGSREGARPSVGCPTRRAGRSTIYLSLDRPSRPGRGARRGFPRQEVVVLLRVDDRRPALRTGPRACRKLDRREGVPGTRLVGPELRAAALARQVQNRHLLAPRSPRDLRQESLAGTRR